MPELPEVETVVRDLRPHLIGRKIAGIKLNIEVPAPALGEVMGREIIGRTVRRIERRGKWILMDLDGPWLLMHLGMTGQLVVVPRDHPRQSHTHIIISLHDGARELRFRDVRRFGSATFFKDEDALGRHFEKSALGPEPFTVDTAYWLECFRKTKRSLKAILLDQRVVAGVGNIYADEALFEAKLHPARLGHSLTPEEGRRLQKAMVKVLTRGIETRGSSIRDYVGGLGAKGGYQKEFRVYGRDGEPCRRCQSVIERIVLAGRSTHFCGKCQEV